MDIPEISYNIVLQSLPEGADPSLTFGQTTVLMDVDYHEMAVFVASWPVGSKFEIESTCIEEV